MKRLAVLLVSMLVLTCAAAFATSNPDPRIVIKDPVCGGGCTNVGTHFTFTSPQGGSGTISFHNGSGVGWHNLELIESAVDASNITCLSPKTFMHCSVTTTNGITTILLSGIGTGFAGIPNDHNFEITFGTWPANGVKFTAFANVPEPTTLALFATGLGVIVRRRRKAARQI